MLDYICQSLRMMIPAGANRLVWDSRGWEWVGWGTYVFLLKTYLVSHGLMSIFNLHLLKSSFRSGKFSCLLTSLVPYAVAINFCDFTCIVIV